jgi:hypothetical protein
MTYSRLSRCSQSPTWKRSGVRRSPDVCDSSPTQRDRPAHFPPVQRVGRSRRPRTAPRLHAVGPGPSRGRVRPGVPTASRSCRFSESRRGSPAVALRVQSSAWSPGSEPTVYRPTGAN